MSLAINGTEDTSVRHRNIHEYLNFSKVKYWIIARILNLKKRTNINYKYTINKLLPWSMVFLEKMIVIQLFTSCRQSSTRVYLYITFFSHKFIRYFRYDH